MRAYGVELTQDDLNSLIKYFDTHRIGRISLNEMLHAMRSNSLNQAREACVEAAYNRLDVNGNQTVTIGTLIDNYDHKINPEFINGWKSE